MIKHSSLYKDIVKSKKGLKISLALFEKRWQSNILTKRLLAAKKFELRVSDDFLNSVRNKNIDYSTVIFPYEDTFFEMYATDDAGSCWGCLVHDDIDGDVTFHIFLKTTDLQGGKWTKHPMWVSISRNEKVINPDSMTFHNTLKDIDLVKDSVKFIDTSYLLLSGFGFIEDLLAIVWMLQNKEFADIDDSFDDKDHVINEEIEKNSIPKKINQVNRVNPSFEYHLLSLTTEYSTPARQRSLRATG